jgi:5'-phosphate synthase pdxT subunit
VKIGILALQGAFIEHKHKLDSLDIPSFYIRNKQDLIKRKDGLILPGGESTAMYKLLNELDMLDLLKKQIQEGMPTFGTCAGMILLAKELTNQDHAFLKLMDITVTRNGYGRQSSSFITHNEFNHIRIPMTFIRAPFIKTLSNDVEILSLYEEKAVAVRQKNMLATSFHPELNHDLAVYHYFIDMIKVKQTI